MIQYDLVFEEQRFPLEHREGVLRAWWELWGVKRLQPREAVERGVGVGPGLCLDRHSGIGKKGRSRGRICRIFIALFLEIYNLPLVKVLTIMYLLVCKGLYGHEGTCGHAKFLTWASCVN